ncbi:acetyl-CoA carboxylase biotin carboxyl carrier protein [Gracilibacillus alcaliphilus]|uniref:acetyl-CoA carboxylase biotin carboxyl carrier protein n=1 Tax=Gracilibacillus alcaliphilus TaxID=1401441 RepID=UPI00195B6DBE|nr:acetyl-CoA carboxylase biotin carboxyl carrier protein [Gracilibacillus alcaliphilus]MBM7675063.1 acetyl-CoA carboxylase biotin carboxyl carrier protein [Gracilibacillus alcaliphilus]
MLTIQEIKQLIEQLDQSSIDEFTYEVNGEKIKVKKNKQVSVVNAAPQAPAAVNEAPQLAPAEELLTQERQNSQPEAKEEPQSAAADYDHEIVSPMVGTFYSSPSPDQPAYVQQGDHVKEDTIVCIVEAMKLFNEIEADVKGTITEILVENGELVEYGQPLFRIKNA